MQTPLQVVFKNMETSDFFEGLIRERVARLDKFHPNLISCRVVVETPHRSHDSGKAPLGVAVEVSVPGRNTIVAKDTEERRAAKQDHTAVINHAFDAVERQLDQVAQQQSRSSTRGAEGEISAGVIAQLFPDQNYGLVEVVGSPTLYFTRNAVSGGTFDDLVTGMVVHVTLATSEGPMGPQASSIRVLGGERSAG